EMVALCLAKAHQRGLHPTIYQQPMAALDLPRRYGTIVVSSSTFQLITDAEQAREAMRRFFAHLRPGGGLVMPFMLLWREGDPLETGWSHRPGKVRPEDGAVVRRWTHAWYEPAAQLEHTEVRYEVSRDGAVLAAEEHRRSPATR